MKTIPWLKVVLTILFIFLIWNYFSGVGFVPFHPDESTQIYMSADATQNPFGLSFSPDVSMDTRMRYRLIDAPLTRTLIGWGMHFQGQEPNRVDWNWSASWTENAAAGALPANTSLLAARWSVAWLFPFTCLFLFLLAKKVDGWPTAVISIILFSTNALVLLHTRRAMAEGALVCLVCALSWLLVSPQKISWLAGLAAGLAANAKQTAIPLAGIGGLFMFLHPKVTPWQKRVTQMVVFGIFILAVTWMFNPVFWNSPLDAIREGLNLRTDLSARMQVDYQTTRNPLEQAVVLAAHVFIQPPAVADVLNYRDATKAAEDVYFSQPQNNLLRGFTAGGILLILTILGWILLGKRVCSKPQPENQPAGMLLAMTAVSVITLLFFTAVPFQRYYIILIPFFSVAQATAITSLWKISMGYIKNRTAQSDSPVWPRV